MEKFGSHHAKFADPLKDPICAMFNITREQLEELKSKVCPYAKVPGMTWREILISFSEDWAKDVFGDEIFGICSLERVVHRPRFFTIAVSDSGFESEAGPWARHFGARNMLLVHIKRPGFTYKGDSRSYLDLSDLDVKTVSITNDSDVETFLTKVERTVTSFFNDNQGALVA